MHICLRVLCCLFCIYFIPKGSAEIQAKRKSEAYQGKQTNKKIASNFGKSWKDFPKAMWNLVGTVYIQGQMFIKLQSNML